MGIKTGGTTQRRASDCIRQCGGMGWLGTRRSLVDRDPFRGVMVHASRQSGVASLRRICAPDAGALPDLLGVRWQHDRALRPFRERAGGDLPLWPRAFGSRAFRAGRAQSDRCDFGAALACAAACAMSAGPVRHRPGWPGIR
ncbi:hypothetical protein ABG067_008685, partial [Albugo candida]